MSRRYKAGFVISIGFLLAALYLIMNSNLLKESRKKLFVDRFHTFNFETENKPETVYTKSKPHFVIGILSAAKNQELRDTIRNTWLWTAMRSNLPFKITYKFLLDLPTTEATKENAIHNDILYLNVTNHGYAVKYGEKIYTWIKYIVNTYSDVYMGARIDDDVFLCVPQIFQRLEEKMSPRLYYGWAHGSGNKLGKKRRVDEHFVVIGRELMERISKRKYCDNMQSCNITVELVDYGWGDESLATWLSVYDDVDFQPDNKRLMFFDRSKDPKKFVKHIKPGFCERWFHFHKSSARQMEQLNEYNMAIYQKGFKRSWDGTASASSGALFPGTVVRNLPPRITQSITVKTTTQDKYILCEKWAVVTTIFPPSKAVKAIASDPQWCLVIVADKKTPVESQYMKGIANNKVVYLSVKKQQQLYPLLAECLSLDSFGRKNVGYIFAMQHDAKAIWDFDDDNLGVINTTEVCNGSVNFVTVCDGFKSNVANPYPYFLANDTRVWPRGFPLQYIRQPETIPRICKQTSIVNLGVVQTLANVEPDVDAIYRMTYDTPFNFDENKETHPPLVLPKMVFAPFNAQATLWLTPAFQYLALPISVNGRVSDIWRSYVTQFFMHKDGTQLAFAPPYVTQLRNEHDYIRDFNAELDLYQKSKQLVDFLSSKESREIHNLTSMYEALYQRDFLDIGDLRFIDAWMLTVQRVLNKTQTITKT